MTRLGTCIDRVAAHASRRLNDDGLKAKVCVQAYGLYFTTRKTSTTATTPTKVDFVLDNPGSNDFFFFLYDQRHFFFFGHSKLLDMILFILTKNPTFFFKLAILILLSSFYPSVSYIVLT